MGRSTAYTGSMTWDTGEGGETRWVFCTAAGQASKTLTVSATGPSLPTRDNIIKNDDASFDFISVQIRTVKTVHTEGISFVGTGGIKRMWAWSGPDDYAFGPLRYNGDGNGPAIIHAGIGTTPWANSQWNMNVGHCMQNAETLNAENVSAVALSPNPYTLLVGAHKLWGIHLQFKPIDGTTPSGPNTWSIEVAFTTH